MDRLRIGYKRFETVSSIDLGLVVSLESGGVRSIQCCHFLSWRQGRYLSTGIVLAVKLVKHRRKRTPATKVKQGEGSVDPLDAHVGSDVGIREERKLMTFREFVANQPHNRNSAPSC